MKQQQNIKQQVVINCSESCLFINNEHTRFQQPLFGAVIHFLISYNLSLRGSSVLVCYFTCRVISPAPSLFI